MKEGVVTETKRGTLGSAQLFEIAKHIMNFAQEHPEAYTYMIGDTTHVPPIRGLQNAVIENGSVWDVYRFARYVPGSDIPTLQQAVMSSGNMDTICSFARYIDGADIQTLQNFVVERGNSGGAQMFARFVPNTDVNVLQQVVLDRGDGRDAYLFARYVPGADIKALQQVVLDRGDGHDMYGFARDIPDADLTKLRKRLVELRAENADDVYLDGFDKDELIQSAMKNADRSGSRPKQVMCTCIQ